MNIAWTYHLHAYYRKQRIEYRYYQQKKKYRVFDKTKSGANNLRFLIGIRHEIEHQMTSRLDNTLSAKFQACCLNYNEHVKKLFGEENGIDKHLAFSLQFSSISRDQADALPSPDKLPAHIKAFVQGFEGQLSDAEFNSGRFAYRVLFVAKTANRKGQADQVIEFVKADLALAQDVNKAYTVIKETERPKHLPKWIVELMQQEGYKRFIMTSHTNLWRQQDAKNPAKGFGVAVEKAWYWYDNWVEEVRKHCQNNADRYR